MNGTHWDTPPANQNPTISQKIHTAVEATVGAEDIAKAEGNSTKMLLALAASGKHIYQGTVSVAEKARRRRRNKAARHARRAVR